MRYLASLSLLFFTVACQFMIDAPKRDNPLDPKNPANILSNGTGDTASGIVQNGILAWWKFNNDGSDSLALRNLNCSTPTFTFDRFNNSLGALGSGTCSMTIFDSTLTTTPLTIELWIQQTANPGANEYPISMFDGNCSSPSAGGYRIIHQTSGSFYLNVCDTGGAAGGTSGSSVIANGSWQHLFFIIQTSSIDVVDLTNGSVSHSPISISSPASFKAATSASFTVNALNVNIDDVRIYNRVLTDSEMLQNHNSTQN